MKKLSTLFLSIVLVLGISYAALALTGDEILTKVDEIANAPKDRTIIGETLLIDKNGNQKKRVSVLMQKGDEKRLIKFLEPPSDRGVGFLSLQNPGGEEIMYLYLPEFKKERRIASHVKQGQFMGSDFSYDDTATLRLSDDYNAEIAREDGNYYVLKLVPKPTLDKEYSYVLTWVTKDNFLADKAEFYDKSGRLLKVQTNSGWKKYGEYWQPERMEMKNVQDNHSTIMVFRDVKFDQNLSDELFTVRNLKRPPE